MSRISLKKEKYTEKSDAIQDFLNNNPLGNMTAEEARAWIDSNVSNIASTKTALKAMLKINVWLTKQLIKIMRETM